MGVSNHVTTGIYESFSVYLSVRVSPKMIGKTAQAFLKILT